MCSRRIRRVEIRRGSRESSRTFAGEFPGRTVNNGKPPENAEPRAIAGLFRPENRATRAHAKACVPLHFPPPFVPPHPRQSVLVHPLFTDNDTRFAIAARASFSPLFSPMNSPFRVSRTRLPRNIGRDIAPTSYRRKENRVPTAVPGSCELLSRRVARFSVNRGDM